MEYIRINHNHRNNYLIQVKNDFIVINEYYNVIVTDEKIIIKRPLLSDVKMVKAVHTVSNWVNITFNSDLDFIPDGISNKYLIDEDESDEDQLVIYFEDKLK